MDNNKYFFKRSLLGGVWALFLLFIGEVGNSQIFDPQNLLTQVDGYLGTPSFSKAFQVGDFIEFEMSERSVETTTARFRAEVIRDSKTLNLYVQQKNKEGKVTSKDIIRPSVWEEMQGNYLRIKIQQMVSYGLKVQIESLSEIDCPTTNSITRDFSWPFPRGHRCLKVGLTATQTAIGLTSQYTFILANHTEGIGQILFYHQQDRGILARDIEFRILARSARSLDGLFFE